MGQGDSYSGTENQPTRIQRNQRIPSLAAPLVAGTTANSIKLTFTHADGDDGGRTGRFIYRASFEHAGNCGREALGSQCDAGAGTCELSGLPPDTPYRPVVFVCLVPSSNAITTCGPPSPPPPEAVRTQKGGLFCQMTVSEPAQPQENTLQDDANIQSPDDFSQTIINRDEDISMVSTQDAGSSDEQLDDSNNNELVLTMSDVMMSDAAAEVSNVQKSLQSALNFKDAKGALEDLSQKSPADLATRLGKGIPLEGAGAYLSRASMLLIGIGMLSPYN